MLRIQCECGKILKVGDALLGKRVKCPACGASQLVQGPPPQADAKSPVEDRVLPRRRQ